MSAELYPATLGVFYPTLV